MHVVVAGWLWREAPSGAGRRLEATLRAVAPQLGEGERITVLSSESGARFPSIPGVQNEPIAVSGQPTWWRIVQESRRLPRKLRELRASVLDLASLPVPGGLPCPVALTIHDLRDDTEFRRRPRIVARRVLRRALRRAAHVIVPSDFTASALEASYDSCLPPISVVPAGVAPSFFRQTMREDDEPYFLHVGHLEPRKNLHMLLDAFALFRDRFRQNGRTAPALVLVGADHGDGPSLHRHALRLGVGDAVRFVEHVDEPRLRDLYGASAAVLLPSLYEGFGMPILEGLAMGRPVLVSDRGALPEVVGDAGQVVSADDPEAWANALAETCRQPTSPNAEQRRRVRARDFAWQDAAAMILEVWRSCA